MSGTVAWTLVGLGLAVVVVRRRSVAVGLVTAQALLLAGAGAILSLPVALGVLHLVDALQPPGLRVIAIALDARMAAVALVIGAFSVVAFALVPMTKLVGADPARALQSGGARTFGGKGLGRFRFALASTQIALSMLLKGIGSVVVVALVVARTGALTPAVLAMAAWWALVLVVMDLSGAARLASLRPTLQPGVLGLGVAHLEPQPQGRSGRLGGCSAGELEESAAGEVHDALMLGRPEFAGDREPQHLAVEVPARRRIARRDQQPAAQHVHQQPVIAACCAVPRRSGSPCRTR